MNRSTAGQAMVEYALILSALLSGILVGSTFIVEFIEALQRYYDGYYMMLNLPIP